MPKELDHYIALAEKMIKLDEPRNALNNKVDVMDHVEWIPPKELSDIDWFRATPSMDPHDVINTGVTVLASQKEDITLLPAANNDDNKKKASEDERVLAWIMEQVNRRRQGTVQKSVVRSVLKYDEVCVNVIDLDEQIESRKLFEGDTKRLEAARRYGRFVVNTYHPNDVHVLHSNLMPEAVLLCQERPAKEVVKEWNNLAGPKLKKAAENDEKVTYYYYQDYDDTVVWITNKSGGGEEEIVKEEHTFPFLPWVVRVGGDTMEHEQRHRRRPLLYSIAQAGSWETQNILESFLTSEAIFNFGSARWIEEHTSLPPENRSTELEFGELGAKVDVTAGGTLRQASPLVTDPGLRENADRTRLANEKSTLAGVLQGGQATPGEAFASINLRTQTAFGSLKPSLELSEYALADIYTLFLLYAHYTEEDLVGFGTGREDNGQSYTIKADTIVPDSIYLSVKLKPDVPLDRQAKANTAMMLVNAGIYSKERAMEDMGITDPDMVTEEMFFEKMTEARWQNMIDTMNLQTQMNAQMQMQAQQQQGLAAQQNEMAGAPGGQEFNPAAGGTPPQEVAPGATREGVTGEDRAGNEALGGVFE
jgi:hypothetical protein